MSRGEGLATESVDGSALSLEGVDDVKGSHGLSSGVLGVSHGVTNDVLEERLDNSSGLLVHESRDSLDSTSASKTTDGGLGDSLNVVGEGLAETLGTALSESLTSFSSSGHVGVWFGLLLEAAW